MKKYFIRKYKFQGMYSNTRKKEFKDMKNLVMKFCCGLVIMMMLFSILGLFGAIESTYTIKNCKVIDVDNDTITVIDNRQNEWKFCVDDNSDIDIGDNVDLVMNNNHTDYTIIDDEVKKVK